ncbi:MAG: GtrA family protein [Paludibacteraceae bacterium]|nr:GtrA family protein [Paludibacteraceae bacterium]
MLMRFVRFGIVGVSGTLIDFGVTWLCKEKLHWNKYLSNSIGFILAATNNYTWNRLWTFESQNSEIFREYGSFVLIALIGLGLNNFVTWLLHEKVHLNFYLSKLVAVGVVVIWNFSMNYVFTFRM